jgi:hypothetical protein
MKPEFSTRRVRKRRTRRVDAHRRAAHIALAAAVGVLPLLVAVGPTVTSAAASDPCPQTFANTTGTVVVAAQLVTIGAQSYCVVDFTRPDSATTTTVQGDWTVPADVTSIEYLVIGGGGGGGGGRAFFLNPGWFFSSGAGGGAGGLLNGSAVVESEATVRIQVGRGGPGGSGLDAGTQGSAGVASWLRVGTTSFTFYTAIGGGGGGASSNSAGVNGASGGGAATSDNGTAGTPGTGSPGFNGGNALGTGVTSGTNGFGSGSGGGGGASGVGDNAAIRGGGMDPYPQSYIGGAGGAGVRADSTLLNGFTGVSPDHQLAGGGGGGGTYGGSFPSPGGRGGFAFNGTSNAAGGPAAIGSGGGGGGGASGCIDSACTQIMNGGSGGAGGSGRVVIRYVVVLESQAALALADASAAFSGAYALDLDLAGVTSGGSGTGAVSYAVGAGGTASGCAVSGSTLSATSAGSCLVTATKASDGQFASATSEPATITFTKASRTLSFSGPASVTREYGAEESFVATPSAGENDGTLTYTVSDGCVVTNTTTISVRASTESCVVTATISEGINHLGATATVTIFRTRRAITITGGSPSVNFGTVYTPTALTSGLVFNQEVDSAQMMYTFTGIDGTVYGPTSTMPVSAGKYHVLPSDLVITGGSTSDYDITYVPGVLQIRRVARTVAFTSPATATVQYGDATAVIATPSVGDGTVTYSLGASTACSVDAASGVVTVTSASGTCVVDATATGGTNHLDATTTSPVTVTVGPRPITVTAGTGSVTLGGTVTSSFSVTTGTMAGTDQISSVTFTYEGTGSTTYAASVTPPTALGTYSVTPTLAVLGSGSVADYTITYAPGTLSIVTPPPPPPAEPEEEETVTGGSSVVPRVPDAPRPTGPTQPAEDDAGSTTQPITGPTSPVGPDSPAQAGDPVPELDRRDGGLPALAPGQVAVTSGGSPESVSVAAIPGSAGLAVAGAGWAITVDLGSGGSATEDSDGAVVISLERSSVATTSGTGFLPGTVVSVWLFSEPTLMVTVTVDEDGEFSSEFLVDTLALEPGPHTLQVQGVGVDGFVRAVNIGLLVAPESVLFESAGDRTGADGRGTPWWLLSSLLLGLLLAAVFLVAVRNRRAAG